MWENREPSFAQPKMIFEPENGIEMSDALNKETVLEALRPVEDPEIRKSLVELNMIQDVRVDQGVVSFKIVLTTPACPLKHRIEEDCRAAVSALPGVQSVRIEFGANVKAAPIQPERQPIQGVKNIIAVASGKGGVGKSTVSVNLALALAKSGAKAGLLDADIYGPNIPMMLGIMNEQPEAIGETILPIVKHDLKIMSIGLLVPPEKALIWRGPMLHSVLMQFFQQVEWEPLDYLVIDLPPGTGDAQLTMTQTLAVSGAVIVTTPQEVALADVRKGINMFQEVNVPILGIVENMSYFVCPKCGERTEIFGSGGGERSAKQFAVPLLGQIPLEPHIRAAGDEGTPTMVSHPQSETAKVFQEVAGRVAAQLSLANLDR